MSSVSLNSIHVNREQEMLKFVTALTGQVEKHVLLIRADRGMGKSSLLRALWGQCAGTSRARINLNSMGYSVENVLSLICDQLGIVNFSRFSQRCEEFARSSGVNIEGSTLFRTQIDVTLGQTDPNQRLLRYQLLTDAFFADLANFWVDQQRQVVFLFDTYEQANQDVRQWLSGHFLPRVCTEQRIVVVLAGQSVPALDLDWQDSCESMVLPPLKRDHVRDFVMRSSLSLSDDSIDLLFNLTDGLPLELVTHIGKLLAKKQAQDG